MEAAPIAAGPVRVARFGDSTAWMTGNGVARWAQDHPDRMAMVAGDAETGCGLVATGTRRFEGQPAPVPDKCRPWLAEWVAAIGAEQVDIAIVQLGAWEIVDHQVEPDGPFLAIGRDAEYEALLRSILEAAIDVLLENSEVVALVANPDVGQGRLDTVPAGVSYPENDPTRSARWREFLAEVAAADPAVIVVDLAGWVHAHPDDARLRPDGVHFTSDTAREVADWLAPEILGAYSTWLVGFEPTPP